MLKFGMISRFTMSRAQLSLQTKKTCTKKLQNITSFWEIESESETSRTSGTEMISSVRAGIALGFALAFRLLLACWGRGRALFRFSNIAASSRGSVVVWPVKYKPCQPYPSITQNPLCIHYSVNAKHVVVSKPD